jgi:hypothetical protein
MMRPRPAVNNPWLWRVWRAKFLRTLLLGSESQLPAGQAERAVNLLLSLSEWVGGVAAEIATISAEQVPRVAREAALERLADRLAGTWKVHSSEVRAALRTAADEAGCSVPAVKRQALRAAAWGVINDEIEIPVRSRLAPDWLIDGSGRRVEAPPAEWTVWETEAWVLATTIRNAEEELLANTSTHAYGEPDDDNVLLSDDDNDPEPYRFAQWWAILDEQASPSDRVLLSAMLTFLRDQRGRAGIYGAQAAAARLLGITDKAARARFERLCAKARAAL